MKNYHDLRVVRTRLMIREAFLKLLEHKHYNEITISELTKAAKVNRVTFYSHYKDLEDFIIQLVDELIEEIFQFMKPLNDKPYEPGYELEAMTSLLQYIADNEKVYRMMFVSKGVPYFTSHFMESLQNTMLTHPRNEQGTFFPGVHIETEIVSWYGLSALIGTISLWLANGIPYSPQYLAEQFVKMNPFKAEK